MSDEALAGVGPDLDRTALVIADRWGRITYWSPGATELFGYAGEAMVGEAVSVLVPGSVPATPHGRLSRSVGHGRP